ncbi:calmodulin-binding protein 60 B-like [Salvia miltiorrhiza]|uniref:calmodulin-binding protein 60 B-like n=1 Tax=Salvia miltiorrhiza TaxID=226208 RepID=UPI0025AB5F79|nr:calmodulin-binding protein 60 B-like [Salvia miltiorrhiza]
MVQKRQHRQQGDEEGSRLPNKRRHFASTLLKGLNHGRTSEEHISCLEPILRKMVQESVEHAFNQFMRSSYNQVECPATRILQLQFHSNLPETLFTGNRLLSEDRSPIKVVLYDSASRQIMSWSTLSSMKVTVVVLDGDFVPDDKEDWMKQEFENKQVKNREGKRPLVAGEVTVTLKDGVGYIGELSFTDNSKWSRTGKFRLGVKAQPTPDNISIREAVSNAFRVKDHRGESYQKHYPPALGDEVWRLDKIAKDGISHKKLNGSGIITVLDFLRLFVRDPSRLHDILGVSKKTWETIMKHANTCNLGEERSTYRSARGVLFFDSIHRVVGVFLDGNYHPADTLNNFQMRLVDDLKRQAYNNLAEWIPYTDSPVAGLPMLLGNTAAESYSVPDLDLHGIEMSGGRSAQLPPSYHSEVEHGHCSYELGESSHCAQVFNPMFRNSFAMSDPLTHGLCIAGHHSWGSEGDYMGMGSHHLSTDDLVVDDAWQGNGLFIDPGIGIISSDSARSGSPKTRWCKVLAVVKWRILVRRNVAARKCKRFYSYM